MYIPMNKLQFSQVSKSIGDIHCHRCQIGRSDVISLKKPRIIHWNTLKKVNRTPFQNFVTRLKPKLACDEMSRPRVNLIDVGEDVLLSYVLRLAEKPCVIFSTNEEPNLFPLMTGSPLF